MAKLSGVEIIIIIGVGFAVFVILFIVAHRQIARFKIRDLLSKPLLKQSQFGASPAYTAQIQRKVAETLDIDVQPQMWDQHWTRYFKAPGSDGQGVMPNYAQRGRALDFLILLKLELLRFGPQFSWIAFEDLGEYFERLKTEFPLEKLSQPLLSQFIRLYRQCRFDAVDFTEEQADEMIRLTTEILDILQKLRTSSGSAERLHHSSNQTINQPLTQSINQSPNQGINQPLPQLTSYSSNQGINQSFTQSNTKRSNQSSNQGINQSVVQSNQPILPQSGNRRETKEEKLLREKGGPKKFPKGYELLESDGSTVGTTVVPKQKERMTSLQAKFRRTAQRKTKTPTVQQSVSWDEQVPLHVFHDNPLISFEPGPSTSST